MNMLKKFVLDRKKLIVICFFIVFLIVVLVSYFLSASKKIDLSSYTIIKTDGLDTQGEAFCNVDQESLISTLVQQNIDSFRANAFAQSVEGTLNKNTEIKNGDKLTESITYDSTLAEQLHLKIKGASKSITVSGLTKGKIIDAFKDVTVSFSGTSPDGNVSVINKSKDPFISSIEFSTSKKFFANGDTVTVTANYDPQEAVKQKVIVNSDEKDFKVSGLPFYLSNSSQLNKILIQQIDTETQKAIAGGLKYSIPYFVNHLPNTPPSAYTLADNYSYDNIKSVKEYIVTPKSNTNNYFSLFKHNLYCIISTVDIIANGKTVGPTYMVSTLSDVVINNSTISCTSENSGQYYTIEKAKSAVEGGYSNFNIESVDLTSFN